MCRWMKIMNGVLGFQLETVNREFEYYKRKIQYMNS